MTQCEGKTVRLTWQPNKGGEAIRNGRAVPLAEAPDLGAGPVYEIEWAPAYSIATVRDGAQYPPRDLEPLEIAAAGEFLRRFVSSRPAPL